ncbi:MAG: cation-transporting P-type ATPase [Candidatus Heimdallarchaeota archaeon]|nr:cation-transporting P-type ATPase [Candidatus Heimdallarchaeota archaeon]
MSEDDRRKKLISVQYILYGHETPLAELEKQLETDVNRGIDQQEAKRRLASFGENVIHTPKPSVWKLYLAPLFDTLILTYLLMTVIMLILAFFVEGVTSKISLWIIMISFNMILAIFQQFKAQKKIEALLKLSPPKARVIRGEEHTEIYARNLVPGDVIELSIGDKVPADARIIRSSNLTVNEASLTGESLPVDKIDDGNQTIEVGTPISQHSNFLYLGTYVQTGTAQALVIRTGNNTEIGKIASAMSGMHSLEIPLRNRINKLGKILALIMIVFLIIRLSFVSYLHISEHGYDKDRFLFNLVDSIIIAMSAVPVNIPLLVTVILISGVLNMASNRVIVKNLSTIETLGRCSVLCSDKTGTLTTSKMSVKILWDTQRYFGTTFRDINYTLSHIPDNEVIHFLQDEKINLPPLISIRPNSTLELLLTSAILNNDAILQFNSSTVKDYTEYDVIGNPTDGALLLLSISQGFDEDRVKNRYRKFLDYPFDSKLKRMSGLFRDTKEGDYMILSKGATEVILPRCTRIGDEVDTQALDEAKRADIMDRVNQFAESGYRVISLAYRAIDELPKIPDKKQEREYIESDLTYIGYMAIYDPPRPGAREAVADLDAAGIYPVMITGDSVSTAATIARQVGILDNDEIVVEGRLAEVLEDEKFFKVSVFARVSPSDKEIIVSRYQNRGDVVTMTGDGINDSLAITRADAGVSMGITGTDVTKEAADLIITDDSYVSLVNGVREGRNLFEKIRIMIFFYLTINLAEASLYFISSFIPDFHLITPWQRIYLFSIIHSFPVLAIIFGPSDREIMKLKPRSNDNIIPKKLASTIFVFSISYLLTLSGLYYLYFHGILPTLEINTTGIANYVVYLDPKDPTTAIHINQVKARTMLISVMYLTESFIVISIRRINRGVRHSTKDMNLYVWVMILLGPIIHFTVLLVPGVQLLLLEQDIALDFVPLAGIDYVFMILFASLPLILLESYKLLLRHRNIQL